MAAGPMNLFAEAIVLTTYFAIGDLLWPLHKYPDSCRRMLTYFVLTRCWPCWPDPRCLECKSLRHVRSTRFAFAGPRSNVRAFRAGFRGA